MAAVSQQLVNMYSQHEAEALEKRNYHRIREMIRVTYTVGYNIMKPTSWDYALKLYAKL